MAALSRMTDAELVAWLINFFNVAGVAPASYGMTAAQVGQGTTLLGDLQTKMGERDGLEDQLKSAVTAQREAREAVENLTAFFAATIKANPNITDAAKELAGIDPNKPPTHTAPAIPTELTANAFSAGYNRLKWKRAGNKPGTVFIIECRQAPAAAFSYLASVTDTSFDHLGVTPGVECAYRVKAQRTGEESLYSNTAVVYLN